MTGRAGGWRWGGALLPMAPSRALGAPRGGHAGISSAAPHAPRCVYGGDCGGGGGVCGCGCANDGGGDFFAEGGRRSRRHRPVGRGSGGNTTTTDCHRCCPSTVWTIHLAMKLNSHVAQRWLSTILPSPPREAVRLRLPSTQKRLPAQEGPLILPSAMSPIWACSSSTSLI